MINKELSVFKVKMSLLFSVFRETDKIKTEKAFLYVKLLVFSLRLNSYIFSFKIILKH